MPEIEVQKTRGITALGALSLVLGALFFLGGVWGLLQPETHRNMVRDARAPNLLDGRAALLAYTDAAMNALLGLLLAAAGVGLLRLRRWGAVLGRWYGMARVVWSVAAFVFAVAGPIANRPTKEQMRAFSPESAKYMESTFLPVVTHQVITGWVLSSLFAVILLCLLSRKTYQDRLSRGI